MRSDGRKTNFVIFDLSKLDTASASAFLADRSQRTGPEALSPDQRCHWMLSSRSPDLLAAAGAGPDFLRERLASGDALLAASPTGIDWNCLFPSEAEAERQAVAAQWAGRAVLFLENTPTEPAWLTGPGTVLRASPEGLWVHRGPGARLHPWASPERAAGVWWVVPGQALLLKLPPTPWQQLQTGADLPDEKRGLPLPPVQAPGEKEETLRVSALRRESGAPVHQALLFHSSDYPGLGVKEAVDFEETLGGIRKRALVANMQGQTDLNEGDFKVRFQGGRLTRIESGSGETWCAGTDSYLEWDGRRHSFQVNSAFSFEGDYSWGLRQSLVLAHPDLSEPGRAILDFYFVEDSPELFVAATVRWPVWRLPAVVTAWAPLELTLFDRPWSEELTTRSLWPSGQASEQLRRNEPAGVLDGTDFLFSIGRQSLALGFPQNQTPRPHRLPWKLAGWNRSRLVVNPEGGARSCPTRLFDGVEEHFSFYLTPAEKAKLPFAVTRKQAIELIPPHVVRPTSSKD